MTDAQGPVERVAADRALREALEVARSWGVPLSRFLGVEPVTRTTYRRDELGRLVEAVTSSSPSWTDDDRDLALALFVYEAGLCPGCRHPFADTTAPEAEERYLPGEPTRCHRCTAASQAASVHRTDYHPSAVFYGAREASPPLEGDDTREDQPPDAPDMEA